MKRDPTMELLNEQKVRTLERKLKKAEAELNWYKMIFDICDDHKKMKLELVKHFPICVKFKDAAELEGRKWFPIQSGYSKSEFYKDGKKPAPHPMKIPWEIAELAYSEYASRYGTQQSLERLADRGGFGAGEMDIFLPDWRERCSETEELKAENERLRHELAWYGDEENYKPRTATAHNAWRGSTLHPRVFVDGGKRARDALAGTSDQESHRSGTIKANLVYKGRSKPIVVEDGQETSCISCTRMGGWLERWINIGKQEGFGQALIEEIEREQESGLQESCGAENQPLAKSR